MSQEFDGKNILIVDDSIVRGTTSREIIEMARQAGAKTVTFTSAAPPVRYPHVYGINMPTKEELIASSHSVEEIRDFIGADSLAYLSLEGTLGAVNGPDDSYCTACWTGEYPLSYDGGFDKLMFEQQSPVSS